MNITRRLLAWSAIVVVLTMLCGCQRKEYQYAFDQPFSNAIKVEVMKYHYATEQEDASVSVVTELDLVTAESMFNDYLNLPCYKHFLDPPTGYGEVILYITYANGKAEVFGSTNSASVHDDGKWEQKVWYFEKTQWCSVLLKYVDAELVPELDKYVQNT